MAETDDDPAAADRSPAGIAQALLFAERHGVLSTLSVHRAGYPYGSLTPYALSRQGAPIILISTLAAHTKNLLADPRACLFVGEQGDGPEPANRQAAGRVSLLGRAAPVAAGEQPDARARYLARIPQAAGYFQTHDFQLWELAIEEVRLIAGFGKIGWVDGAAVMRDPRQDPLAAEAAGICRHMNDDHAEALRTLCQARGSHPAGAPRMVSLDAWGFDVEREGEREGDGGGAGERRLRFDFPRRLTTAEQVRREVIVLLRAARG